MYIWGYQTPVFIPIGSKKNSFLVKFFHSQGTNVHLGLPNSSFYPNRVKKTSFLVKFFHFQGTNVNLGVPISGFYPHQVKKTSFLVKFFHFYGTNVHLGVPNSSFYPQFVRLGKKNFIFSEIFPFLGNKCTFGGTKLQFLSPSGQKTSFLVTFFHFQGTNVHLGLPNSSFYPNRVKKTSFLVKFLHFQGKNLHLLVPNSSFYPQFVRSGQKKLIFSEIFPFLGNKCTFGGTKLQFLSPSGQKKLHFQLNFSIFREQMYIWGYQTPVFIPNLYDQVKKNFIFSEIFPFLRNKCTFGGTKLQFLSPICTIGSKKLHFQ